MARNTNKLIGNSFENEFCKLLGQYGFWAHNMAQNKAGQPADVIAVRKELAYLIDCKVCKGKDFLLSRVEPNQHSAMALWKICGNGDGWFCVKYSESANIYMVSYSNILRAMGQNKKSLRESDMLEYGIDIDRWVVL